MSEISIITKQQFNKVVCDFLGNEKEEIFMTSEQLGQALGYLNPRKSISNLVNRHPHLKNKEFSGVINLVTPSGRQSTRVFTEDGIYEVTLIANTDTALRFRYWVRKVLKEIRKNRSLASVGLEEIIPKIETEIIELTKFMKDTEVKVEELQEKVDDQMTIDYGRQMKIQLLIRERVVHLLGGKTTISYTKLRAKYFAAIYRDIKKRMGVSSYRDIRIKDYEEALTFIERWEAQEGIA